MPATGPDAAIDCPNCGHPMHLQPYADGGPPRWECSFCSTTKQVSCGICGQELSGAVIRSNDGTWIHHHCNTDNTPLKENPVTDPTTTGEAVDVTTAVKVCQDLRLQAAAMRERIAAQVAAALTEIEQMQKAAETLDASARDLEFDQATLDTVVGMFDALTSMAAAVTDTKHAIAAHGEAVIGATTAAETEFSKHLPGVELNAAVGGMAKRQAYETA
jgi:hypothetical protein